MPKRFRTVSQHNYKAIDGARACALIALHAAERFSKQNNDDLENLCNNESDMQIFLQSIVIAGVSINAEFSMKERIDLKDAEDLIPIFKIKKVCQYPIPIMKGERKESISDFGIEVPDELSQDDIMYIAIGHKHVTLFFKRNSQYYFFNSATVETAEAATKAKHEALSAEGINPYSTTKLMSKVARGLFHKAGRGRHADTVTTLTIHDSFGSLFDELQHAWASCHGIIIPVLDSDKYKEIHSERQSSENNLIH